MPKPIPMPTDYRPTPEVLEILDRGRQLAHLPEGATPDQHTAAIQGLQFLQNELLDEWLRALARAQGSGALPHRQLTEVTGYKAHRNVQKRVYEGRELLAADAAQHRKEAG